MLGPRQQIFHRDLTMVSQRAGEAGGILSWVASSGVEVIDYVDNPAEAQPLGVQLHNVEIMDETYMYNPWRDRGVRQVSKPGEQLAFSSHCEIDTNFIHPNATPHSGKKAYLGPSGLITDDASFGGEVIGRFLSSLNDVNSAGLPKTSGWITIHGGGFVRGDYMKKVGPGKFEIQQESIELFRIVSPGWARVKIDI
jgi:hypothetical protein